METIFRLIIAKVENRENEIDCHGGRWRSAALVPAAMTQHLFRALRNLSTARARRSAHRGSSRTPGGSPVPRHRRLRSSPARPTSATRRRSRPARPWRYRHRGITSRHGIAAWNTGESLTVSSRRSGTPAARSESVDPASDVPLSGPGTGHLRLLRVSRTDYLATEDDNVAGAFGQGRHGLLGFYYDEHPRLVVLAR